MADMNSSNDEKNHLSNMNDSAAVDMPDSSEDHIDMDDSTVKFIPNGGGKKMDVEEKSSTDMSFTGLGKEELMRYADDPFWKRVRLILFVAFWVGWLAMLVAAIVIIVYAPRCPYRPEQKWFDKETVYQVYPKSFKDSTPEGETDGAGVGDLIGINSKLDYLKDSGSKTLYISSFYENDGIDGGMGVLDHKAIDPQFGTMSDFDAIRKKTKKDMMHLILDFIPNHTSREHKWFEKSKMQEGKYTDYYVWAECDPKAASPLPNNWLNMYGEPAWTYNSVRNACYYHKYMKTQPDLNLKNKDVKAELESILRFWLDKGVDGFNVIGAEYLVEGNSTQGTHAPSAHEENVGILSYWRNIADSYATKPGREKLLMTTVKSGMNETAMYYKKGDKNAINFVITEPLEGGATAQSIRERIQKMSVDSSEKRAWSFGNQDTTRLASMTNKKSVKAMLSLQMLLPGIPVHYYGNELGMEDGTITFNQTQDILGKEAGEANYKSLSRDPFRTPMQWDSTSNAGFTVHKPWLPVNSNYKQVNTKAQSALFSDRNQGNSNGDSHPEVTSLSYYKKLTKLREAESFQFGKIAVGVVDDVLWFTRKAEGFDGYVTMINLGTNHQTPLINKIAGTPKEVELVLHSHYNTAEDNKKIDLTKTAINIDADQVVVLKYAP